MSEPEIIEIQEWEEKILSGELATDERFLEGLSYLSDRKILKFEKFDRIVKIKAKSYVGVFNLKDGNGEDIIIYVKPRININLVWMITISGNFKKVKEMENLISILSDSQSDIDLPVIGVIRRYLKRLSEALTYGFLEMSKTEVEESTVIRGRIVSSMLPKTLFSSPSSRIAYEVQYYTVDNLVNQYILDAGYMLYIRARELLKVIGEDPNIIHKAMLELGYSPSLSTKNVNIHDLFLATPQDRPYISELLILAEIIRGWLENEQLPHSKEFIKVPALYINMNNLFERFVRGLMKRVGKRLYETKGIKIKVRKAHKKEVVLLTEPEPIYLKPDMVIKVKGKPVAVGDVKYKPNKDPLKSGSKGDRNALYQVHTYMHYWNVDKGFLVYPTIEEKSSYNSYTLKDGKKLYIIKINTNELPKTFEKLQNSELFKKLLEFLEELVK